MIGTFSFCSLSIYEGRLFVFVCFCHVEISQNMVPLAMLLGIVGKPFDE
jgi:hypothetical protein